MGIREDFNTWPLGRQLQALFNVAGLLLTLILVIITKFQLDWLRTDMVNQSQTTLESNILVQMRALGLIESRFITSELQNYIAFVEHLDILDSYILGNSSQYFYSDPFNQTSTPEDTSIPEGTTSYSQAVYFTSNTLSSAGIQLLNNESSLDPIYPFLYVHDYLGYYQGYQTDEIIHEYPGAIMTDTEYTPLVREWYYKAAGAPFHVNITEPYTDATTGLWVITVSKAILSHTGALIGVAAADVTLGFLTKITEGIVILDTGFVMLISAGGMILTMPPSWYPTDGTTSVRIYDTVYTGITVDQWNLIQNTTSGTEIDFNDVNGTYYLMVKYDIAPYDDIDNATHYLLVCVTRQDADTAVTTIQNNFTNTYNTLFWVALSFGIVVFVGIFILIYFVSKQSELQFKVIEKLFAKIIRRGLFPKMTKGVYFHKMDNNSKNIESLVDACKEKVQKIKEIEENFSYYKWGLTRPNDCLQYNDWTNSLYPYNNYTDRQMPWRETLPELRKIIG